MKQKLTTVFNARYWSLLTATVLLGVLTACGGGNGSAGNPIGGSGGSGTGTGTGGSTTNPPATGKAGSISFVSSSPSIASIVFQGTGGAGRTSTAELIYKVLDTTGNPLAGVTVSFASTSSTLATLSPTSAVTAKDGTVKTAVTAVGASGTPLKVPAAGTLTVTATVSAGITAISNQVIVSTGIPAAKSFTITPTLSNVEGWDFPGTSTTIGVYITDTNGNPVVDGTAVAATTNEGAIGSSNSSNPGCTTVNGTCTLVFTSQDPKWVVDATTGAYTNVGIATISLTATDGTGTPITGSVQLTQSGSWPAFFVPTNANWTTWEMVASAATPVPQQGHLSYQIVTGTCDPDILFVLTDEVGNPIANGTTVSVTAPSSGPITLGTGMASIANVPLNSSVVDYTVPVAASTITNIQYLNTYGPSGVAAYNPAINGTLYSVPITSSNCNVLGGNSTNAVLNITIKSLKGDSYGFSLNYKYPS